MGSLTSALPAPFYNDLQQQEVIQTPADLVLMEKAGATYGVFFPDGSPDPDCGSIDACSPGDTQSCGFGDPTFSGLERSCVLRDGAWRWDEYGCNTPLVLSFDNSPVEFTEALGWFDLVGAGLSANHDWVSAKTPWLVLDKNDNGSIDDGSELFGSMSVLGSGARARNGFVALSELDSNGDQRVSASDEGFERLALWRDRNQDRQSSPDELESLAESGISALALDYTSRGEPVSRREVGSTP